MKHQQVVVDYGQMFKTSLACIVLVFFVWIFIKLIQSVFLLPRYLERNHQRIADSFEKRGLLGDDDPTECIEDQKHEQTSDGQNGSQSKKTD